LNGHSVLWVCSTLIIPSGFSVFTALKYEIFVVFTTAKYNFSQAKRAPRVALQQLPDAIPAYLTAAHHPAAVSAARGARDGELQDLVSLPDIGDVPGLCSLEASGSGVGCQGDQRFGRKPDRRLVMPDWQPSGENFPQPLGESARSDLVLQNVLFRINWVPPRQVSPP